MFAYAREAYAKYGVDVDEAMKYVAKTASGLVYNPTFFSHPLSADGDFTSRLAYLEEIKTLPFGIVWDAYCERQNVPTGDAWLTEAKNTRWK